MTWLGWRGDRGMPSFCFQCKCLVGRGSPGHWLPGEDFRCAPGSGDWCQLRNERKGSLPPFIDRPLYLSDFCAGLGVELRTLLEKEHAFQCKQSLGVCARTLSGVVLKLCSLERDQPRGIEPQQAGKAVNLLVVCFFYKRGPSDPQPHSPNSRLPCNPSSR